MRISLDTYYRFYKLLSTNRLRYYSIVALRSLGFRFLVVRMDPNWLCNLRCRTCYFSSKGYSKNFVPPMGVDLFRKISKEVFGKTRMLFLGCGAEPLMTPDLPRFFDIIRESCVPFVAVVTNGQLLTEEHVFGMIKNKIDQLIVSIDGAKKETYEGIRIRASFEKLLENLEMVKRIKSRRKAEYPAVRFNFTAMRRNVAELKDLVDLAVRYDVSTIRIRYLTDWGGELEYGNEILRQDEIQKMLNEIVPYARSQNLNLLYPKDFDRVEKSTSKTSDMYLKYQCLYPWYTLHIRGDGKATFCHLFGYSQGDFTHQKFKDIYYSEDIKRVRKLLAKKPMESCLKLCKGKIGGL